MNYGNSEHEKKKLTGKMIIFMGLFFTVTPPIILHCFCSFPITFADFLYAGIGIFLLLIGIRVHHTAKKNIKYNDKVIKNGITIEAELISTQRENSLNSWEYFDIDCEWVNPKDNQIYHFQKSIPTWIDPKEIMEQNHIETLKVYIDPTNYSKYYIDTDLIESRVVDVTKDFYRLRNRDI